jgi:glycosyltransferase involved in cell wall biosynthesis
MAELSLLIPARNELWLKQTVVDVLSHMRGDTEIIVVLDGAWPEISLDTHPKVHVVFLPESIGQRAATNLAARMSTAKYVMKLDAHCSVADGFDVELMRAAEELGDDVTQIPAQYNLHAFDWVCDVCGNHTYQGPTRTACDRPHCPSTSFHREVLWQRRMSRLTTGWVFDHDLRFAYSGQLQDMVKEQRPYSETMSCLGACWFMSRKRYWQIGGMDEKHGSWGQMGTELGCKSWLSGGRMVTNHNTWYGHMFRTQGGDFGFPYPISGVDQDRARAYSQDLWKNNKWKGQKYPLKWLVQKFAPAIAGRAWRQEQIDGLPDGGERFNQPATSERAGDNLDTQPAPWRHNESVLGGGGGEAGGPDSSQRHAERERVGIVHGQPTAGLCYYSDCRGDTTILQAVRDQLLRCARGRLIASVTLGSSVHWDTSGIDRVYQLVPGGERGYLSMFRQILAGLEALDTDYAFLVEHDCLYHPSHFDFVPPRDDVYYYNLNVWKVNAETGHAVTYETKQTSGLCANRHLLLEHYRKRVKRVEQEGFSRKMGFEPGSHNRPERVDDIGSDVWRSASPNLDIRHGHNLTESRWSPSEFRSQRNCRGWQEADTVPGWDYPAGRFMEWLTKLENVA